MTDVPYNDDQTEDVVSTPEDIKKEKRKKSRNMGLLFLLCAVVGGGGFIYISEPQPQNAAQIKSNLDKRLQAAAGSKQHPAITGRRNYVEDFATKVTTEVGNVESKVGQVENQTSKVERDLATLQKNFGLFLEQYQAELQQRRERDEDLQVVLEGQQNALNDLESNQLQNNGLPPAITTTPQSTPVDPYAGPNWQDDAKATPQPPPPTTKPVELERTVFTLSKRSTKVGSKTMSSDNYLPPGSYAEGRIIMGAKTSAAVDAQSDPRPILIRINSKARGPVSKNGEHTETDIEGCTVTASAYGDISSEQGHAKLQEMACTLDTGEIRTTRVYGYIGYKGMYGVHSKVIMREGDLVKNAFWAGMLSKGGEAANTLIGETSSSAHGIVKTTGGAGDAALELLSGGLENTSDELGRYYMKRLEQIQPVIPLKAGTDVVVVFMKGTDLDGVEVKPKTEDKQRIPLDAEGSDVSANNINMQLLNLIKQNQRPDATKTNWNNELY